MRKIAKLMLTPLLVLAMLTATFASSPGIVVNNKKLPINAFNRESRVLVPLRAILESLNATVDYDDSTKTITGSQDDNLIILKIGEKAASVNGKKITLDVPAQIIMGLTVVPVRFISESLGASVVWADKIVFIESVKTEVKQPKSEIELLAGYIVIRDNTLHFDEVEIIEPEDKERIKELGLDEDLPPTGFKILNEIQKEITYELTDETVYNFLDVYRLFVEDENEDRAYATTNKDEFLKHLGEYNQNDIPLFEQTIPYFIEVQDGKVISITEKFKFTI